MFKVFDGNFCLGYKFKTMIQNCLEVFIGYDDFKASAQNKKKVRAGEEKRNELKNFDQNWQVFLKTKNSKIFWRGPIGNKVELWLRVKRKKDIFG